MRRRAEFVRTYREGKRAHGRYAAIFCFHREDAEAWQLGLTTPRKVGGAVVRNRMKRRTREFFRRRRSALPAGWDFVVNPKPGAESAPFLEFERDLCAILRRLGFEGIPEPGFDMPQGS